MSCDKSKDNDWQLVDELPNVVVGKAAPKFLFYSTIIGLNTGTGGNFGGYRFVNINGYHGNAIEHWGVTHFIWLPDPPVEKIDIEK